MSDKHLLDEYQTRCTAVQDIMHHVVTNPDVYGFYLWGPRGCGKTTGIERALAKLKVVPVLFRGTSTGESLFNEVKMQPDKILWFNDDRRIFEDKAARQYLLAMLEDTTDPRTGKSYRLVTKSRVAESDRFIFTGKILFDANLPIAKGNNSVLEAVKDRMVEHHFGPTDSELAAVMRYLARQTEQNPKDEYVYIRIKGKEIRLWKHSDVKERLGVVDFLVEEAKKFKVSLSLRMFRDALNYYVGQQEHGYTTDWRDYVTKELTRHDVEYQYSKSRTDARLDKEREELRIYLEDAQDMMESGGSQWHKHQIQDLWMSATKQNDRQFRRRLTEMPAHLQAFYEGLPDKRHKDGKE